MSYIGYFRSLNKNKLYKVQLGQSGEEQEIYLGSSPCTVRYNESSTPFEPIRTSQMTIQAVWRTYLEDVLTPYAQGTRVVLTEVTNEKTGEGTDRWVGYLTPRLYDQPYEREYEEIEFEASDAISSLQYINYSEINGERGFVSFAELLNKIVSDSGVLTDYFWSPTKRFQNDTILMPSDLYISEQNFFSNDTDEPWTLYEVLEELCKYIGMTALQYGRTLYLLDYNALSTSDAIGNLTFPFEINKDVYKLNGETITFEPVYNKVVVQDNMYIADSFIPGLFDDVNLTNWEGEDKFYASHEIYPPTAEAAKYPYGRTMDGIGWGAIKFKQAYKDEEKDDKPINDYTYHYFERNYTNKYWDTSSDASIIDFGYVKKIFKDEETGQYQTPNKLDYTRYLRMKIDGYRDDSNTALCKSKKFKSKLPVGKDSFLILNCNAIYEKYVDRPYINPDWNNIENKANVRTSSDQGMPSFEYEKVQAPELRFMLRIGKLYWSGQGWVSGEVAFNVALELPSSSLQQWNTNMEVLNNVYYDMYINDSGYKIPLEGVDVTEDIEFSILPPYKMWKHRTASGGEWLDDYNAWCWISNFSLKVAQKNQDFERVDSDVVFENIIDSDAVNELSDITLKFTSYADLTKPSYSNVLYGNEYLKDVSEAALSNIPQLPEQNIIEKYVKQYSTPTKKFNLTLSDDIPPYALFKKADVDNPSLRFVELGREIDYSYGRQTITIVQKK